VPQRRLQLVINHVLRGPAAQHRVRVSPLSRETGSQWQVWIHMAAEPTSARRCKIYLGCAVHSLARELDMATSEHYPDTSVVRI
jgi:hypothetical protein